MADQSVQTRSRRVMILRRVLLGALVAVLIFVPDDRFAVRIAAGIVVIAVFWFPPLVAIMTGFREGYRSD